VTIEMPSELPVPPSPAIADPNRRKAIRQHRAELGTLTVVLDDDPTGSQTVHGIQLVTSGHSDDLDAALAGDPSMCFALTNTRSLSQAAAIEMTARIAYTASGIAGRRKRPLQLLSRGDSTLRGHVIAEMAALDSHRRSLSGEGYSGIIFAPAFFEAGRFTANDVQWATQNGTAVPVGSTEFARDPTFAYQSSNLREFIAEKSRGTILPDDVASISLQDIRNTGPDGVAAILSTINDGRYIAVNAMNYEDLEIVVLCLQRAELDGQCFTYRTGPSFVRALAGIEPQSPIAHDQIWPNGRPAGRGIIVVGSHVQKTTRQLIAARERLDLVEIALDVPLVVHGARADRIKHLDDVCAAVQSGLTESDVLLCSSRQMIQAATGDGNLAIARSVSAALCEVTRRARAAVPPAWVVAKGGITSHDVAVSGLGIRRALVIGQVLPGLISVFRPIGRNTSVREMAYVVFAGNVGDDNTLGDVVELLRARQ
jgi:uncharacterized protein YgbK (DUF1537 family)